ncbi:MAG TPA: 6-phosphofructokinase [Pirellulales bacterium]|jgi:6-phosphofructokinase 1|nr:6-phosphofructokinase [Pirellulales bacterium]
MSLSRPPKTATPFRRVAILFAGGPAPAANAVISTAANSFLRNEIEVVGIMNGYSRLLEFCDDRPLQLGRDYIQLDQKVLKRTRNTQGILIGTARANPGRDVSHPDHLNDPVKVAPLRTVYEALRSIGVDAVISIGGDDTLKTANKLKLYQDRLPTDKPRMPVVHLPKTIDNDYMGIDFTFGYFTAVDTLAAECRNLLSDAEACRTYFLLETMGRSAGWLAYGVAVAGEASAVISVEDITGKYRRTEEVVDPISGEKTTRDVMNVEEVVNRLVATMVTREQNEGKEFGVMVLAEGLAEYLPMSYLQGVPRDEHGHIATSQLNLCRLFSKLIAEKYTQVTGNRRKITGLQIGYEARCSVPHAFDVMLGSQLGVGAYRALVEERLNGVMVSVSGQLELNYVPFEKLVDPESLVTVVRYVRPNSDFHRLARFLETYVNE